MGNWECARVLPSCLRRANYERLNKEEGKGRRRVEDWNHFTFKRIEISVNYSSLHSIQFLHTKCLIHISKWEMQLWFSDNSSRDVPYLGIRARALVFNLVFSNHYPSACTCLQSRLFQSLSSCQKKMSTMREQPSLCQASKAQMSDIKYKLKHMVRKRSRLKRESKSTLLNQISVCPVRAGVELEAE